MRIENTKSRQNFQAIHIASLKSHLNNKETPLEIYQLTKSDRDYLTHLTETIDFEKLMPSIDASHMKIWKNIFRISKSIAFNRWKTTLLCAHEGKPCGIMVYSTLPINTKLDTICTWPTKENKKVPNAGQTLFYMLFKNFLNTENRQIELNAITNGPFDAVSKYMKLGFKQYGGENNTLLMRAKRNDIHETFKRLNTFIKETPSEPPEEINLFEKLT